MAWTKSAMRCALRTLRRLRSMMGMVRMEVAQMRCLMSQGKMQISCWRKKKRATMKKMMTILRKMTMTRRMKEMIIRARLLAKHSARERDLRIIRSQLTARIIRYRRLIDTCIYG
jgi:hypothetical protein